MEDVEEEDVEALLEKAKERISHENEDISAKYSQDLNSAGEASSRQPHRQGNGDADLPQSEGGGGAGGGGDMRSKILTGMKKIMQNLMGSSEEESERLLIQLAREPKSSDVKDKIKVAIEKMMASSDTEKSFPREQLKSMIQGLSQGNLVDDLQEKDNGIGKRENFDHEVIGKDGERMLFPSNREDRMLDDKDYDPLKGLDRKEYFDWVNPPGFNFEAGAPGSPEEDEDDEEDAEKHGYLDDDEDEGIMGDVEFYPSDEEERSEEDNTKMDKDENETNLKYNQDKDEVEEEFCLPGEECKYTSAHPAKYLEEQQIISDHLQTEPHQEDQESDNTSFHGNEMKTQDEAEGAGNMMEGNDHEKLQGDDDTDAGVKHTEGEEGNEKWVEEMEREEGEDDDDDDNEGGCEGDGDEEECMEEEETVYPHRELTSEEIRVQKLLDGEITEETKAWMKEVMTIEENAYFLLKDLPELETVMTEDQLNGSNRVVADGIAADQECSALLQLLDSEAKQGDGYKGKKSPHTKYENFEGLTVKDAVDAAQAGRIPLLYPTIYMHLAERSRQYLQRHFQLKTHLFFSFTHLVCRSAGPDSSIKRDDLSHPVHADNCQLDHKGKCHKRVPAFVWRDWSAILYLNQEFEGGEFIFANFNQTAQAVVSPKCGRLVGFSAGEENLHGVKGVLHGRRCALAMWYTLDPRFRELEFFHAADHLNLLYEAEYKQQH